MRTTISVLLLLALFSGCTTLKKCNKRFPPQVTTYDSISHEVKYLKKDSVVYVPADSAWYRALIECTQDKQGRWMPTVTDQQTQSGSRINISSQQSGNVLMVYARVDTMAIGISWMETHAKDISVKVKTLTYPVEKKLTWWQRTIMINGYIFLGMILLVIIWVVLKFAVKVKFL